MAAGRQGLAASIALEALPVPVFSHGRPPLGWSQQKKWDYCQLRKPRSRQLKLSTRDHRKRPAVTPNQSINHSINKPIDQSINQPIYQSISLLINQLISLLINQSINYGRPNRLYELATPRLLKFKFSIANLPPRDHLKAWPLPVRPNSLKSLTKKVLDRRSSFNKNNS